MVAAEIRGKTFPLCLTVAALDQLTAKCGGLKGLTAFLTGDGSSTRAMVNMAWMLGLLITEGEEHRLMEARFSGEKAERIAVPGSADIAHLLTGGEIQRYYGLVWQAVNESLRQTIEAEPGKNG